MKYGILISIGAVILGLLWGNLLEGFFSDTPRVSADNSNQIPEKLLRIQVVNEKGKPIDKVSINGTWSTGDSFFAPESVKVYTVHGETDAQGQYSTKIQGNVTLTFNATGYFEVRRSWYLGNITDKSEIVALNAAPVSVPMIKVEGGRFWFNERHDSFTFGIQIVPTGGAKAEMLDDKEKSDIWFNVLPNEPNTTDPENRDTTTTKLKRNWQVTVQSQNGWQIAPGPAEPTSKVEDPRLLYAPATGYSTEIHYSQTDKVAFFLFHQNSGRYGKISGFRFTDKSTGEPYYGVGFKGLVQSENVGTNSLYPLSNLERLRRESEDIRKVYGELGNRASQ